MNSEERLSKIPVINWFVQLFQGIKIPGLEGMSLFNLLDLYINGIIKGALTARASSIAFSFFIALFPATLFILTLIPNIPIEGFQEDFLEFIFNALPSKDASDAVTHVVEDIANNKYAELLSFGFILSIFLMTNGVNAILSGFEYSYHQVETRTVLKQYFVSLLISMLLAVLLIVTVSVLIFLEFVIVSVNHDGTFGNNPFWIGILQLLFLVIMVYIAISLLFYFGTKEGKKMAFFSPGTVLTIILYIISFKIFQIYIEMFAQYNVLYGSIGTVLVIMLFIWVNSIILLLGFELNVSLIRLKEQNKATKTES